MGVGYLAFEKVASLSEQPGFEKEESTMQINNIKLSGLRKDVDCLNYYIRAESSRVWKELTIWMHSDGDKSAWLQGPPGVGKSTEIFAFTMNYAMKLINSSNNGGDSNDDGGADSTTTNNIDSIFVKSNNSNYYAGKNIVSNNNKNDDVRQPSVLWIHQRVENLFILKVVNGKAERAIVGAEIFSNESFGTICNGMDLVVLDGIKGRMKTLFCNAKDCESVKKILACTSYGAGGGFSNEELSLYSFQRIYLYSWSKEDIVMANNSGVISGGNTGGDSFDHRAFFPSNNNDNNNSNSNNNVLTNEELDKRYYYAGGCMRYMNQPTKLSMQCMEDKLQECKEPNLLLRGLQGLLTTDTVNSLMAVYRKHYSVPVSKYVCDYLATKVNDGFIREAYVACGNNGSLQGWIFEMDIIRQIRQNKLLTLKESTTNNESNIELVFDKIVDYLPDDMNFTYDKLFKDQINVAIIPVKVNQGCFDFVHYSVSQESSNTQIVQDTLEDQKIHNFVFYQCTISTTHQYKCQHVATLLQKLIPSNSKEANTRTKKRKIDKPKVNVSLVVVRPYKLRKQSYTHGISDDIVAIQNFDEKFTVDYNVIYYDALD